VLAAPLAAEGQQAGRIWRIGFLSPGAPAHFIEGFRMGMKGLGYTEGQNTVIIHRSAEGRFERLPDLAIELARSEVDVIVAVVTQASVAAQKATRQIPIVMVGVADPVGVGLVKSLARPGGNITGTSSVAAEAIGKQLELLKETIPNLSQLGVLWNPTNEVFQALELKEVRAAARAKGVQVQLLAARNPEEIGAAFQAMTPRIDALFVLAGAVLALSLKTVADLASNRHLPSMGGMRSYVEAGGLMGYGPSYLDLARRSAYFVDKILKGAKPADLPIEQPTKFELAINLKTAKALGLTIPRSLLLRADQLIE
jgi:putative tryptophan/tyrosine transport system substrate-binding protein